MRLFQLKTDMENNTSKMVFDDFGKWDCWTLKQETGFDDALNFFPVPFPMYVN